MRITLLGVLVVLGAGVVLWYVLYRIEQHSSESQQVHFDEQPNPSENFGPDGNPEF